MATELGGSMHLHLDDLILMHLKASGPCTFPNVVRWVAEQYNGPADEHDVAGSLTVLIRKGWVRIYDTGDSFDTTDAYARA